jgi:hypothetical protein
VLDQLGSPAPTAERQRHRRPSGRFQSARQVGHSLRAVAPPQDAPPVARP